MKVTQRRYLVATAGLLSCLGAYEANAQVQPRFKPLGSPSAVDAYTSDARSVTRVTRMQATNDGSAIAPPSLPPSGFGYGLPPSASQNIAPTMQPPPASGGFGLPPAGTLPVPLQASPAGPIAPPSTTMPGMPVGPSTLAPAPRTQPAPSTQPVPRIQPVPAMPPQVSPAPRGLPVNPNVNPNAFNGQAPLAVPANPATGSPRTSISGPNSDYNSIAPPQLNNAFATMDNCRNISGPSTYRASGAFGCGAPTTFAGPAYAPAAYVPPPSQIAPAVALPPGASFGSPAALGTIPPVIPGNSGYRPLITLGQESNPVQVGQGIIGQPVAYVPGQCFRNALRYISF